jgi:hypothetical protein
MASKRSYLQAAAPILSTYSEGIISTHRTIFNFQHRYRPSPSIIEFPAGKNISIKSGLIRHREPINLRDQKISLFKTFGIGNIFPIYISLICFCKWVDFECCSIKFIVGHSLIYTKVMQLSFPFNTKYISEIQKCKV